MNRLANSQSPYLLQHKNNPVDWYPWGKEAFEKAKKENKPIFLSIGYSTCHWCHVMEHESFEDKEVAKLMNDNFISIKVDREEMPEIDHLYMSVCQAMTGRGGWPLTVVMSPKKEPFFAGTYFPKTGRGNQPGMMELIPSLMNAWNNKQDDIKKTIKQVNEYLINSNAGVPGGTLDRTHASELQLHCSRSIPGFSMLDYIGGAMACAERERWPRLGLSTTRRALNQLALRYNDAKIQMLDLPYQCMLLYQHQE